jgi:tight adherence protein C
MMQIAVLSSAILAYALVMMIAWRSVRSAEHMRGRVDSVARIGAAGGDANDLSRPFGERFLRPAMADFTKWLAGLMPQSDNPRLANSLKMAGIRAKTGEYNATRLIVSVGAGLVVTMFGVMMRAGAQWLPLFLLGGVALGLVMQRYMLHSRIKKRRAAIQRQLPEVLDLLSVSVEAGLGFDAALQRISDRAKGELIDELTATYREISLGRPRSEALRNFEQRCGLEEIKSFVGAIIQAEQLGISLKNVLKSQAQQMRQLKKQRIEEKAMKTPVKIIFPLVFFVFPVLFIILLGPAIMNIMGMKGIFG